MVQLYAVISRTSPIYEDWLYVLGSDRVPVESSVAKPATAMSQHGVALFYRLDITRLTLAQRARLVDRIAEKWEIELDQIERAFLSPYGIPILADDVTIVVDERMEA